MGRETRAVEETPDVGWLRILGTAMAAPVRERGGGSDDDPDGLEGWIHGHRGPRGGGGRGSGDEEHAPRTVSMGYRVK